MKSEARDLKTAAAPILLTALTAMMISVSTAPAKTPQLLNNKITKAQCLKKPGYVWIESSKRCVKQPRGSY